MDTQFVEEADQEEISEIALLTEACLRVKGGEQPTMKEVEMRLQFLRTKRLRKRQHLHGKEEDIEPFLCAEAKNSLEHIKGVLSAESSRSVRGLRKGVSGKPYPRLCNARRLRLEPRTFRSQAVRLYRLHQARPSQATGQVIRKPRGA